ncbi:MAG: hypothetical protein N4A45_03140 [Flavobacteriales bacterium]|jgi:hypothetical protein|nr:hypothetical protein [Flavobacteriales bacterium]
MKNRLKFDAQVGWAMGIEDKDALLGYFVSDTKYSTAEIIELLELVYSKKKTFDEALDIYEYGGWDIGSGSGTFSCDAETAYFTSDVKSLESTEIPLKELIEILYAWKDFLDE